jgi:nanoRNase/pAp phosphatase (c-di-AMP/oligoRNAs hydrolase)
MSNEELGRVTSVQNAIKKQLDNIDSDKTLSLIIFTHRQADPDALCAAGALVLLLESSFPDRSIKSTIVTPQGVSNLGSNVGSSFDIPFQNRVEESLILDSDLIIIVDTGDSRLLEPFREVIVQSSAMKILIDHHFSTPESDAWSFLTDRIVRSDSTSTCEIIVLGFPSHLISKKIGDILLAGLLFDSQHLGIATERTLEAALILVKAGSEISTAKRILRYRPDRSEILGRMKAAQRLQYEETAGRVIAKSEISSYHAAVARMLVEMGADVGIAFGESKGEARLSARSAQSFFKETGIDLAVEIRKVADYYNLVGGGHSTAASLSGEMESAVLANHLVQNLKARLLQK